MTKLLEELHKELDDIYGLERTIVDRVLAESKPALTDEQIKKRVQELAVQITRDYPEGSDLVLVALMEGARPFATDLCHDLDQLQYRYTYTTMSTSSYREEVTSGELEVGDLPKVQLTRRNVLVLDDVCDTAKTLVKVKSVFSELCPKSLNFMTLVNKEQKRDVPFSPNYVGFEMSADHFLIGKGMDYMNRCRDITDIRLVDKSSLPTEVEKKILARKKEVITQIIALTKELAKEKLSAPAPALSIFEAMGKPEVDKDPTRTLSLD